MQKEVTGSYPMTHEVICVRVWPPMPNMGQYIPPVMDNQAYRLSAHSSSTLLGLVLKPQPSPHLITRGFSPYTFKTPFIFDTGYTTCVAFLQRRSS